MFFKTNTALQGKTSARVRFSIKNPIQRTRSESLNLESQIFGLLHQLSLNTLISITQKKLRLEYD